MYELQHMGALWRHAYLFSLIAQELPSERDSPETLRAKMGTASGGSKGMASMPLPNSANKFGKATGHESNPFGYSQDDADHYWYVAVADNY